MTTPTEFKLPQHQLDALLAITRWYDMMPQVDLDVFYAGDRFHERISEFQMSHLPEHPFFNTGFCSHFEIRDGVVYAALDQVPRPEGRTDEDPYTYVPFVAE